MQLIGDLPLSALGGLLSYAEEQELKPLWIANFAVCKLTKKECISYEDFISGVFGYQETPTKNEKASAEKIDAELSRIADIDRERIKKGG